MKHLLPAVILLSGFCLLPPTYAEDAVASGRARVLAPPAWNTPGSPGDYAAQRTTEAVRAWKRSVLPFAATQGLDITSSYGMRELNPLLAGGDGRFGAKATGIKIGTAAAVLGIEYLIIKKWPGAARTLARLNWGSTALTGAIAAHNFAIR